MHFGLLLPPPPLSRISRLCNQTPEIAFLALMLKARQVGQRAGREGRERLIIFPDERRGAARQTRRCCRCLHAWFPGVSLQPTGEQSLRMTGRVSE